MQEAIDEEAPTSAQTIGVLESEKVILARRIGVAGTLVACALAKLYLASPNPQAHRGADPVLQEFHGLSQAEWKYTNIMGFAVLVIDHKEGALIIRIYQYKTYQLRFAYEIYLDMEYKMLDPQFHAFEIENCVAGLSFSVKSDALLFHSKMQALKPTRKDGAATILRKMRHPPSVQSVAPLSSRDHHRTHADKTASSHVQCTPEQVEMVKQYQEALKKYEADMAKYKAEQEALAKYEEEQRRYLKAKAEYDQRLSSYSKESTDHMHTSTSIEHKEDDSIGGSDWSTASSQPRT